MESTMKTEDIFAAIFAAIKQLKEEGVLVVSQALVAETVLSNGATVPLVMVDVAIRKLVTANKLATDSNGGLVIVKDE